MRYKYDSFIPQNIAPKDVKRIGVYKDGERVCTIPLGHLAPISKTKLYSFGLISDTHVVQADLGVAWNPSVKLDNALSYFEREGCLFCCHAGDITNVGFYRESDPNTLVVDQFAEYKRVCDSHAIPIYEICGNHESYVKDITNNLTELSNYAGAEMYYSVTQGDDIYLFLSQPAQNKPMTDEALQWLYEQLEANRNKRCFVFVHPYITNDSGNALSVYGNPVFDWWGNKTTAFKNLLKHYKNTVLFHGHSHMTFDCQALDDNATYTEKNRFKSVHIPSISRPANIVDGSRAYVDAESYGYLVDVYDNCVVLNGWDFVNNEYEPLGVYKIDTKLVEIPANTFTDNTGTITI